MQEGETVEVGVRLAVIGDGAGAAPAAAAPRRRGSRRAEAPRPRPHRAEAPAAAPRGRRSRPGSRAASAARSGRRRRRRPPPAPAAAPGAAPRPPPRRRSRPESRRRPSCAGWCRSTDSTRRRSGVPATAAASPATTCSKRRGPAVPRPPPLRRPRHRHRRRAAAAAPAAARPAPVARADGDTVVPFDNIRRRTAEHMVRSKATSAHVYTSVEVDFERIERVRRDLGPRFAAEEGFQLTYLPFICRAFSDVVHRFPNVNASVDGDALVVHHDIHLGIAVDLDFKGLLAPVVRNVDGKRLRLIAHEIRDLATRAKQRTLTPDEVVGGTFTITNMGPFGTALTLPIINQPQVAILATDSHQEAARRRRGPRRRGHDRDPPHRLPRARVGPPRLRRRLRGRVPRRAPQVLETHDWEPELA